MEDTGNYYLINHLVLFTGLSDRTIRNYIASGILQGEKINGLWHFTPEQVNCYISNPAVRPSILAKNNAAVYDFLMDSRKTACETCMILDLPGKSRKEVAEYFCYHISNEDYRNIHFSFDGVANAPRIILKGDTAEVLRLVNGYVRPELRSQGIGKALYDCAEAAVKADGMEFILLSTPSKDHRRILHFYIDELGMEFWSARLYKRL